MTSTVEFDVIYGHAHHTDLVKSSSATCSEMHCKAKDNDANAVQKHSTEPWFNTRQW